MKKMRRFFVVVTVSFLCLFVGTSTFAEEDNTFEIYAWSDFEFTYPAEWDVVLENDVEGVRHVKLVAAETEDVSILVSLFEEFTEIDEHYEEMPVMASVSFGLGLALKLAGSHGESAIALNYRSLEFADGPVLSAVFTIMPPDSNVKEVHMLECFHDMSDEKDKAFFGMILSKGKRGQLIENPKYAQYIEEAYAIARSISIE